MQYEAFTYIWHNLTNNRKYVGYHKGIPNDGYIASSKSDQFWSDFNNSEMEWHREIIFEGTKDECLLYEQNLLKNIDFNSGEYYNMARGAEVIFTDEVREKIRNHHLGGSSGMKGKSHSEETKKKQSEALKGRILTEEHRQNLRKPKKNTENMKGPLTEEHKQALRDGIKQKRKSIECPHCHELHHPGLSKRWHFDNCKQNPLNSISKHEIKCVECPHCHKQGNVIAMGRWHFDNCKLKPHIDVQGSFD